MNTGRRNSYSSLIAIAELLKRDEAQRVEAVFAKSPVILGKIGDPSRFLRTFMAPRRFPPPWSVETTDACFIVRDRNKQALTYIYFEEKPGRRPAAKLLSRDEARRIALSVAKLPELLRR